MTNEWNHLLCSVASYWKLITMKRCIKSMGYMVEAKTLRFHLTMALDFYCNLALWYDLSFIYYFLNRAVIGKSTVAEK